MKDTRACALMCVGVQDFSHHHVLQEGLRLFFIASQPGQGQNSSDKWREKDKKTRRCARRTKLATKNKNTVLKTGDNGNKQVSRFSFTVSLSLISTFLCECLLFHTTCIK